MDLRLEAAAISEMAENVKADPGFRVPKVDWKRTSKRVLTIEWIDGIPIGDRDRLVLEGLERVPPASDEQPAFFYLHLMAKMYHLLEFLIMDSKDQQVYGILKIH